MTSEGLCRMLMVRNALPIRYGNWLKKNTNRSKGYMYNPCVCEMTDFIRQSHQGKDIHIHFMVHVQVP